MNAYSLRRANVIVSVAKREFAPLPERYTIHRDSLNARRIIMKPHKD